VTDTNTQVDIHSNVFNGHWDMVYCVYTMYLCICSKLLLCRLQLKFETIARQLHWLYLTLHLLFFQICSLDIGHDVFSVYSTQVLVQREIRSKIERESNSAAPNLRLCTFGSYLQFKLLLIQNLCRPQLNSRTLYLKPIWLIPNTQVDDYSAFCVTVIVADSLCMLTFV